MPRWPVPSEQELYEKWKPLAKSVKTAGQMTAGAATIVGVIAVVVLDAVHFSGGSESFGKLTADVFAITAAGLAVAAAFELAYTLYTPGPDKALNPLLLGTSSAFLFLASKDTQLDWQFGFAAAFVTLALYGLFKIRERFNLADEDDVPNGDPPTKTEPGTVGTQPEATRPSPSPDLRLRTWRHALGPHRPAPDAA